MDDFYLSSLGFDLINCEAWKGSLGNWDGFESGHIIVFLMWMVCCKECFRSTLLIFNKIPKKSSSVKVLFQSRHTVIFLYSELFVLEQKVS
jgi:hypothetical protein